MTDVLRRQAEENRQLLERIAARDRKLPRAIKRQRRQHDDGEHAKGFTQPTR